MESRIPACRIRPHFFPPSKLTAHPETTGNNVESAGPSAAAPLKVKPSVSLTVSRASFHDLNRSADTGGVPHRASPIWYR